MRVVMVGEVEERFGIDAEQLDAWERDAADGVLHGEPRGAVVSGRPLLFGEETKQVGFREPVSVIERIDQRARQLGMRRSDYLRHLVDVDLATAGALRADLHLADVGAVRTPPLVVDERGASAANSHP